MNRKLLLIVIFLWTLSYCAFGQATQNGPFDPGALRSNLSNASPTASLSIRELILSEKVKAAWAEITGNITASGTMRVDGIATFGSDVRLPTINGVVPGTMLGAATADYVATGTFTGHTGATGTAVHGLGTMSTQSADSVAITGGVASLSALTTTGNVLIATSANDGVNKLQVNGGISCTENRINSSNINYFARNKIYITSSIATGTAVEVTGFGAVDYRVAGIISVFTSTLGRGAVFDIAEDVATKLHGYVVFTHTKDTASSVNIYVETGKLYIQNLTALTFTTFGLHFSGLHGS